MGNKMRWENESGQAGPAPLLIAALMAFLCLWGCERLAPTSRPTTEQDLIELQEENSRILGADDSAPLTATTQPAR